MTESNFEFVISSVSVTILVSLLIFVYITKILEKKIEELKCEVNKIFAILLDHIKESK